MDYQVPNYDNHSSRIPDTYRLHAECDGIVAQLYGSVGDLKGSKHFFVDLDVSFYGIAPTWVWHQEWVEQQIMGPF